MTFLLFVILSIDIGLLSEPVKIHFKVILIDNFNFWFETKEAGGKRRKQIHGWRNSIADNIAPRILESCATLNVETGLNSMTLLFRSLVAAQLLLRAKNRKQL